MTKNENENKSGEKKNELTGMEGLCMWLLELIRARLGALTIGGCGHGTISSCSFFINFIFELYIHYIFINFVINFIFDNFIRTEKFRSKFKISL